MLSEASYGKSCDSDIALPATSFSPALVGTFTVVSVEVTGGEAVL